MAYRSNDDSRSALTLLLLVLLWRSKFVLVAICFGLLGVTQFYQGQYRRQLNNNPAIEWQVQRNIWHTLGWDTNFKGVFGW